MRRGLTVRQRVALRRIARSLAAEAPELARQLHGDDATRDRTLRLGWWSPAAFLFVGAAFVVTGLYLELGSAVILGFGLLSLAHLRRTWLLRRGAGARVVPTRNSNWQNG